METIAVSLQEALGFNAHYLPYTREILDSISQHQRVKEIMAAVLWQYKQHDVPFFSPGASYGRRFCEWLNSYYQAGPLPYTFFDTEGFRQMAKDMESLAIPNLKYALNEHLLDLLVQNPSAHLVVTDALLNQEGRLLLLSHLQLSDAVRNRIVFVPPDNTLC